MKYYKMIEPWEPEILGVKDGLEQARTWKSILNIDKVRKMKADRFKCCLRQAHLDIDKLGNIFSV